MLTPFFYYHLPFGHFCRKFLYCFLFFFTGFNRGGGLAACGLYGWRSFYFILFFPSLIRFSTAAPRLLAAPAPSREHFLHQRGFPAGKKGQKTCRFAKKIVFFPRSNFRICNDAGRELLPKRRRRRFRGDANVI